MPHDWSIDAHETTDSTGPISFTMAGPVTDDATGRAHRRIAADLLIGWTTDVVMLGPDEAFQHVKLLYESSSPDVFTVQHVYRSSTGSQITFPSGSVVDVIVAPTELSFASTVAANTFLATQTLQSDDAGGSPGPQLYGYRKSTSPAGGDFGFKIGFDFNNAGGARFTGASLESFLEAATAGGEHAGLHFFSRFNGAQAFAHTTYGDRVAFWLPVDMAGRQLRWQGAGNYTAGFSDGTLDTYGGGTRRLRLDSNGRALFNASTTNARIRAEEGGATNQVAWLQATDANYASTVLVVNTTRTANSAFVLADFQAAADSKFRIRGDGQMIAENATISQGAGPGEYWEWADGNPALPDGTHDHRLGWAVVLADGSDGKIRIATADDDPEEIIGATSATASVVSDAAEFHWHGKWLRDAWGRPVLSPEGDWLLNPDFEKDGSPVLLDENGAPVRRKVKRTEPAIEERTVRVRRERKALLREIGRAEDPQLRTALKDRYDRLVAALVLASGDERRRREIEDGELLAVSVLVETTREVEVEEDVPNPDYDPELVYRARRDRPEWVVVESGVGKVRLRKAGPKHPRWRKLRDVSEDVELWLVRP
jgi:hypothetical protein